MHGREFTTRDILEFDGILMPGQPALVINMLGQALSVVRPEPELETEDEPEGEQAQLRSALGATPMVFRPVRVLSQPD